MISPDPMGNVGCEHDTARAIKNERLHGLHCWILRFACIWMSWWKLNTWHALATCRLASWHIPFWQLQMIRTSHVSLWTWPGRLQTAAATTLLSGVRGFGCFGGCKAKTSSSQKNKNKSNAWPSHLSKSPSRSILQALVRKTVACFCDIGLLSASTERSSPKSNQIKITAEWTEWSWGDARCPRAASLRNQIKSCQETIENTKLFYRWAASATKEQYYTATQFPL